MFDISYYISQENWDDDRADIYATHCAIAPSIGDQVWAHTVSSEGYVAEIRGTVLKRSFSHSVSARKSNTTSLHVGILIDCHGSKN